MLVGAVLNAVLAVGVCDLLRAFCWLRLGVVALPVVVLSAVLGRGAIGV